MGYRQNSLIVEIERRHAPPSLLRNVSDARLGLWVGSGLLLGQLTDIISSRNTQLRDQRDKGED
jgi:hypothetical protein